MKTVKQIQRNNAFKNLSGIVLSVDRTLIGHEKKNLLNISMKKSTKNNMIAVTARLIIHFIYYNG
jgi:hypothetical protein